MTAAADSDFRKFILPPHLVAVVKAMFYGLERSHRFGASVAPSPAKTLQGDDGIRGATFTVFAVTLEQGRAVLHQYKVTIEREPTP